jgi:prophage antirepressor-like protein
MSIFYFEDVEFTLIVDDKGKPWLIAKELCDYLERSRDTLIRQVG